MRVMLALAALAAAMFFDVRASHAYRGPWCAVQSVGVGTMVENCNMLSFEQCRMEVIAGNRGFCKPNPYWPGAYGAAYGEPRRWRKHRARRR